MYPRVLTLSRDFGRQEADAREKGPGCCSKTGQQPFTVRFGAQFELFIAPCLRGGDNATASKS